MKGGEKMFAMLISTGTLNSSSGLDNCNYSGVIPHHGVCVCTGNTPCVYGNQPYPQEPIK
jgi:hypothetical protein